MQAGTDPDDVDYRIQSADLMKVDRVRRRAVNMRLRRCQSRENGTRPVFDLRRQVGGLDNLLHVGQMSLGALYAYFNMDARSTQPPLHHRLRLDAPAAVWQVQAIRSVMERRQRPAGVHQAAEKDVTGNSGRGV